MTPLTVYKLDENGRELWRYPAVALERGAHFVRLEAFFDRDAVDLGVTTFQPGDRFVETFYDDRWYNIFAVYDGAEGALKGWYCNVCRPAELGETAVRCEDLALDIWVSAGGEITVMDEDAFAALPLSEEERAAGQTAVQELFALAQRDALPL